MTAERFAVPRDADGYQVSSKTFSRQSITGTNRDGAPRSVVQGEPERRDPDRLVWHVDARPT
jgi:hypothetical protein